MKKADPGLQWPIARRLRRAIAIFISCSGLVMLVQIEDATVASISTLRPPAQGLVYTDLVLHEANCLAGYQIEGTDLCTHGPDAAPQDVNVRESVDALATYASASYSVFCDGNGTSGKRVQIMYVRAEDRADRYAEYVESIRAWSAEMDEIFDISAQATGGRRRIRFVTDDQCQIDVLNVVVPVTADDTFRNTIRTLRSMGYNSPDRKYVMFVDANVYCGIATAISDSSASAENRNNRQAGFARIDSGCWSGPNAAHELVHLLGGVQHNAPNTSGSWHCTDEFDLMCYSDAPHYPTLRYLCPAAWQDLLDCNHDDYFHTDPPPDSYLAMHWNVANSAFLLTPEDVDVDGQGEPLQPSEIQVFLPFVMR